MSIFFLVSSSSALSRARPRLNALSFWVRVLSRWMTISSSVSRALTLSFRGDFELLRIWARLTSCDWLCFFLLLFSFSSRLGLVAESRIPPTGRSPSSTRACSNYLSKELITVGKLSAPCSKEDRAAFSNASKKGFALTFISSSQLRSISARQFSENSLSIAPQTIRIPDFESTSCSSSGDLKGRNSGYSGNS